MSFEKTILLVVVKAHFIVPIIVIQSGCGNKLISKFYNNDTIQSKQHTTYSTIQKYIVYHCHMG